MAIRKIEHKAPKKHYLTLNDLAAFVDAARHSGADGTETVGAVVSIGGRLQALTIEVDAPAEPLAPPALPPAPISDAVPPKAFDEP